MDRPNILLLHADQHRWDCIGYAGNSEVKTPHLDALAADSVQFTNSFCVYPICTPSRYSLLSGQYVHEHCGYTNHSTPLPSTPFFPQHLKQAGYRTKAVGKMHFTPTYLDVGFDEMLLAEQCGDGRWDDDYHRYLRDNDLADINDMEDQINDYRQKARPEYSELHSGLVSNLPEEHYPTTWIGNRAVEAIEEWNESGNLLMAGFIKPHHPDDPPAPWDTMYDPQSIKLLPGWTENISPHDAAYHTGHFANSDYTEEDTRRLTALYYSLISLVDKQIGRIIDTLKAKGLYENTMIIFTSDHGDYRGYHHMIGKCNYLYEPIMRVPLLIKYPDNRNANMQDGRLVNNIDLAPTILKTVGCEVPEAISGRSLQNDEPGHALIFAEYTTRPLLMARDHRYKLILSETEAPSLFFDLQQDPYELNNCFDDPEYAAVIKTMTAAIMAWQGQGPKTENHVNYQAPQIKQNNVPPLDNSHREEIQEWYAAKWREVVGEQ